MDPEGRAVKISSGKRPAACEEWMRNRRICGKLTIDTAVFIFYQSNFKKISGIKVRCSDISRMKTKERHKTVEIGILYYFQNESFVI